LSSSTILPLKTLYENGTSINLGHVFIGKVNVKTINVKAFAAVDVPNNETVTFYIGVIAHAASFG
jgi:hypothetical protein